MGDKVHHEECDIADYIDVTQGFAELDTVKCCYTGGEPHQIAEMQVAMTLTNVTMIPAMDQRRLQSLQFINRPVLQYLQRVGVEMPDNFIEVVLHRPVDRFLNVRRRYVRVAMRRCKHPGD